MPKVILVKQAQSDYDKENRIQGLREVPLNEAGKLEAKALAKKLGKAEVAKIFSSPQAPSKETADTIAKTCSLSAAFDERLCDMSLGRWDGLTEEEARKGYPIFYAKWERDPSSVVPPGGEGIFHVLERVTRFWFEKVSREKGVVVIVSSKIVGSLLRLYIQSCFNEAEAKQNIKKFRKIFSGSQNVEEFEVS
ncbi:MAG: histidine phosphatase family protein [Candidatus Omnitrophica bacterium]|nr:histidine phosphatase family protein [Candidatus Omnitrophota bacterium]